ncbi:hypothetical protein HD806DRAFT_405693 [Xylariaceae sp. AK1471]|nr:hypothetical protein HD806DRAFT_405693 [Xylariaceae sp. AK1471]
MQLRSAFVFLSALAVTTASPLGRRCGLGGNGNDTTDPGLPTPPSPSVTYVLPSTGGATSLPAPDAPLKHIVVGHGVQNYTCAAAGAAGKSIGALAVLYDITGLYPGSGPRALSPDDWNALTSKVLRTTSQPIIQTTGSSQSPFPAPAALTVSGIPTPLPFLGHHFFDEAGVPTFELNNGAELFKGAKLANIAAPASADQGLSNEGAVDWLYLADKGTSVNISKVYRVLTSGGNTTVCGAAGEAQSIPYTAMYWIY